MEYVRCIYTKLCLLCPACEPSCLCSVCLRKVSARNIYDAIADKGVREAERQLTLEGISALVRASIPASTRDAYALLDIFKLSTGIWKSLLQETEMNPKENIPSR